MKTPGPVTQKLRKTERGWLFTNFAALLRGSGDRDRWRMAGMGLILAIPAPMVGSTGSEKNIILGYLIRVSNIFRVLLLAITNLQISMKLEIELLGISIRIFSHLQDWVFNH